MQLEKKVLERFTSQGKTLSVAESCTGGLVGDHLTNVPGSSAFFLLGIIAYDNKAKIKLLGVPAAILKKYGAVSAEAASAMARGARKILNTDYGLSITGIAGPSGGTKEKPVGLVFVGLSSPKKTITQKFLFKGSRISIKKAAAQTALKLLANQMQ